MHCAHTAKAAYHEKSTNQASFYKINLAQFHEQDKMLAGIHYIHALKAIFTLLGQLYDPKLLEKKLKSRSLKRFLYKCRHQFRNPTSHVIPDSGDTQPVSDEAVVDMIAAMPRQK